MTNPASSTIQLSPSDKAQMGVLPNLDHASALAPTGTEWGGKLDMLLSSGTLRGARLLALSLRNKMSTRSKQCQQDIAGGHMFAEQHEDGYVALVTAGCTYHQDAMSLSTDQLNIRVYKCLRSL